jgi:hypothetical protein
MAALTIVESIAADVAATKIIPTVVMRLAGCASSIQAKSRCLETQRTATKTARDAVLIRAHSKEADKGTPSPRLAQSWQYPVNRTTLEIGASAAAVSFGCVERLNSIREFLIPR